MRRTRKAKKQKGGNVIITDADRDRISRVYNSMPKPLQGQVIHCMSQLFRFQKCLDKVKRRDQFFFNLGRLKELLGETTNTTIWWDPFKNGGAISRDDLEQLRLLIDPEMELEPDGGC
jgi:hypothetical protein